MIVHYYLRLDTYDLSKKMRKLKYHYLAWTWFLNPCCRRLGGRSLLNREMVGNPGYSRRA